MTHLDATCISAQKREALFFVLAGPQLRASLFHHTKTMNTTPHEDDEHDTTRIRRTRHHTKMVKTTPHDDYERDTATPHEDDELDTIRGRALA